jgi:hypothetical protein
VSGLHRARMSIKTHARFIGRASFFHAELITDFTENLQVHRRLRQSDRGSGQSAGPGVQVRKTGRMS